MLVDFPIEVCKNATINPFSCAIRGLCRIKDIEGAKNLFAEMIEKGPQPWNTIFNMIINSLSKAVELDDAKEMLTLMESRGLSGYAQGGLQAGYCNLGEYDKALKLMSEMKEYGVEPNVDEYNKLIQSPCLKALDWKRAEKLLEEMKEKRLYLPGITRGLIYAVKEALLEPL